MADGNVEPTRLTGAEWVRIERVIEPFEAAWRRGERPAIDAYLPPDPALRRQALIELVHTDLEYRLAAGEQARLEAYLERYPELGEGPGVLLDLLKWEHEQRRRRGQDPQPGEYARRFPAHAARLEWLDGPGRLGRYKVVAKLGEGDFGAVYKGYDEELGRDVAIKVPHRRRIASEKDVGNFLSEARTLARLNHPGIVPVYECARTPDGLCYLVSRFIDGIDLRERLRRSRLAVAEAVELVAQVAEALHHAHEHGLVHRDVKPANILLDVRGRPVVADFGLALRLEDYGTGPELAGTPAYMSPEQARRESHRVDARTDIYSLGVVFYELLTGGRPFTAPTLPALLEQIATRDPEPPRQRDDAVPEELSRICLKALARPLADRYATAAELARDLRDWQKPPAPAARRSPAGAEAGMKKTIVLKIDRDFASFTSQQLGELFGAVQKLAGISDEVQLIWSKPGSVRLALELSAEDAARLLEAVEAGKLEQLRVVEAREVSPLPGAEPGQRGSGAPSLEDLLAAGAGERRQVLLELICMDLENRLKRGEAARVEDYLGRFPELAGDSNAVLTLVIVEYQQCRQLNPSCSLDVFLQRFPQQAAELRVRFKGSDRGRPQGAATPTPADSQFTDLIARLGHKAEDFRTARRDIDREQALPGPDESARSWEALSREPTPSQAALLAEAVQQVTASLEDERERQMLELSLQGLTVPEISARLGRSERTVQRVLTRIRNRLERLRDEGEGR